MQHPWQALSDFLARWHQTKLFVEHLTTVSHDLLHVMAGFLISLVAAALLRRPITSWLPWLATLAIILLNEAADLWVEIWPDPGMQFGEGAKDVVTTMAIPTILALAVKLNPRLFQVRSGGADSAVDLDPPLP